MSAESAAKFLSTMIAAMPDSRTDLRIRQISRATKRSQAFSCLVKNQQRGIGHRRSADREHLLLAAGELLAAMRESLGETWKSVENAVEGPVLPATGADARRHQQIFSDREVRKIPRPSGT